MGGSPGQREIVAGRIGGRIVTPPPKERGAHAAAGWVARATLVFAGAFRSLAAFCGVSAALRGLCRIKPIRKEVRWHGLGTATRAGSLSLPRRRGEGWGEGLRAPALAPLPPLLRPAATCSPPPRKGEGVLRGVRLAFHRLPSGLCITPVTARLRESARAAGWGCCHPPATPAR